MPDFCFHRFLRDDRGVISIMAALSLVVLLALAAIVIDGGSLYFARRNLQATSDAAALAAVQSPSNAMAVAQDVFTRNGYTDATLSVTPGTYTPDESLSVSGRFAAASTGVNAVRVNASRPQTTYFAGLFGLANWFTVTAQSTAARVPTLSFGAGTRLASLNAGLINSLLGQLWGSSVNLSAVDYDSLIGTNVDALTFLNQLATDIDVTGNYQQLAQSNITIAQLLNALIETANTSGAANGDTAQAVLALKGLQGLTGATSLPLSSVIDLTPLYGRTIGGVADVQSTSLQLNLMSILSASARTTADGQLINLATALTVPGGPTIAAKLAIGSPMAQVADAKVGTSINTAQIRMTLVVTPANLNLGLGNLASVPVTIPIYLEGASGQATLTAMPCTTGGTLAEIAAVTGATTVTFGTVTDAALKNFSTPVTPSAASIINLTILGIPILQVNVSGTATVAASGPTTLDFSQADIDAGTIRSAPGSGATPFTALGTGMTLSLALGSINLPSLKTQLINILSLLNAPVNTLLTTLGLQLGIIDVQAFDASCRTPVLVG